VDIFANLEPSRHTTSTSPGVAVVQFLDAVCNGSRA
jgi:hypothetical protein